MLDSILEPNDTRPQLRVMAYTKKDFGRELLNELAETSDVYEIARWTFTGFLDTRDFGSGVQEAIMEVIVIEEGPRI